MQFSPDVIVPERHTRYLASVTRDSKTFETIALALLYLTETLLFVKKAELKEPKTRYSRGRGSMTSRMLSFLVVSMILVHSTATITPGISQCFSSTTFNNYCIMCFIIVPDQASITRGEIDTGFIEQKI